MKYIFIFGEVPPNNNVYLRMHWTARSETLAHWTILVKEQRNNIHKAYPLPRDPIKECGIVWRLYVKRARDWDNAAAMFKAVGDAFRYAEVIAEDNPKVVKWFRVEQVHLTTKGDAEGCDVEVWTGDDLWNGFSDGDIISRTKRSKKR